MKILHIGKYFYPSHGGIESFLMDLACESAAQGVEQGILVHAQLPERSGTADLTEFPFLTYFDRVATLGSFGYAPISPTFRLRLNRALKRFTPDLLYLHLPNPSAFWALTSGQARRRPWVIHWHSDASGPQFDRLVRLLYPAYRVFEQALLKRADRVIVTSAPYLENSLALKPWQEKCRVVPLGLSTRRIEARTEHAAGQQWAGDPALRLLAVGRLTPYKGFDVLIQAMIKTRARLTIVGEGIQKQWLEQLVIQHQIQDRVRLIGAISDAARNSLLSQCDLVCLPSLNRAEAFGISVLEAMALGKPALVSDVPGSGLPWLVQDGRTGWHVEPGHVEALAAKINWLDAHRSALAAAGEQARQRYVDHFDIRHVARQIIDIQRQTAHS